LEAIFHIVTGNTRCLENIKQSVLNAGLRIKGVVLEPIASAESTLDDIEKKAGVALVDIGGGTTDIAIFEKGVIRHTAVIPMAGNLITKDIHEGCTIARIEQAENLKIKFGCCLPSEVNADDIVSIPGLRGQAPREISMKTLAGIINARAKMILELVTREIEIAGFSKKLMGGMVLTGGGAQLKYIKELASYISAINTRIGIPNEYLETPNEIEHPMYATGVGLVLCGLKEIENNKPTEEKEEFVPFDKIDEEPDIDNDDNKKPSSIKIGEKVSIWLNKLFKDDNI
jgi:cell division protein FtsA